MALCGHSGDPHLTRIPEAAEASKCGPLVFTFSLLLASIFIGNNRVFRKKKNSFQEKQKEVQSRHSENTKGNKTSKTQSIAN